MPFRAEDLRRKGAETGEGAKSGITTARRAEIRKDSPNGQAGLSCSSLLHVKHWVL